MNVVEAGEYEIRLRRWPEEVDAAIDAPLKPGAKEVVFELKLPAGRTEMSALFETAEGEIYGAYYAYVTKK